MKKQLLRIVTLIFLVLSINPAQTQPLQGQAKIDSLLKEFPKMKKDTNAVNLLSQLSFDMYASNPDKGIKYGEQGLKLAENIGWKLGKANCLRSLGVVYSTQSNYPKALEYMVKSLKISEELGNKKGVAGSLNNIGTIYHYQSNYPKALEYYQKALKINEELRDKRGIATTMGNIGNIYNYQLNYPKALEYYQKALKINEELENKGKMASNIINIGSLYSDIGEFDKSLEYLKRGLVLNEEIGNQRQTTYTLNMLAVNYIERANNIDSLQKIGEIPAVISLINKEQNYKNALEFGLQAESLADSIGLVEVQWQIFKTISSAYEGIGKFEKGLEYYKKHQVAKDSVFNKENGDKISALEKAREDDLNRLKIEKQEILLKAQEDEKQLIILSAIGALISILIILFVIINQRSKSEKLLLNVLPAKIAKRLKAKEHPIADHFDSASIMFIDIVGFTKMSSETDPKRIVAVLNDIFTIFDKLAEKYGLEKIKTIGDAYMAAAGIPEKQVDHAKRTAEMALNIKSEMKEFRTSDGTEIKFRIGIECGSVVAGVIGEKKFIYDLWSDAVNIANRMESTGESGKIHISENFKNELEKFEGNWQCTFRGEQNIKGKGIMNTYFLEN